jgi:SAM-dependent methyltransferase
MRDLGTEEGRSAFGLDPENYDRARPPYPKWVFEALQQRCGLESGTRTFEIGPGTGSASARLLEIGARPLVLIEPDPRLANFLSGRFGGRADIVPATFEDAELVPHSFDLGAAATSFHWMEQKAALAKVAALLRSGGWWAMWSNVFGDLERSDCFHEATQPLLQHQPNSPSHYAGQAHPYALDSATRLADLAATGVFIDAEFECRKWTLVLDARQVRALYATFSQFGALEPNDRERILDGLMEIAEREFGGRVERNMCTVLYTARRT